MVHTNPTATRTVQRVRHEPKLRLLEVARVVRLTPKMTRVTLTGADLPGFYSAAHDDHVKVFFPPPGKEQPILPSGPPGAPVSDEALRPIARDYTPRRYDAAANELDIDFVLHGEGPAATWVEQVKPGQKLGVGGPRGSFVVSAFDCYWLIGDEAALPAIGRRLEELPADAKAIVIAEVDNPAEQQDLRSKAQTHITWVHRQGSEPGTADLLLNALSKQAAPAGDGYTWIACESNVARRLRQYLVSERGFNKEWVKAAGYWKHGAVATHEKHED